MHSIIDEVTVNPLTSHTSGSIASFVFTWNKLLPFQINHNILTWSTDHSLPEYNVATAAEHSTSLELNPLSICANLCCIVSSLWTMNP